MKTPRTFVTVKRHFWQFLTPNGGLWCREMSRAATCSQCSLLPWSSHAKTTLSRDDSFTHAIFSVSLMEETFVKCELDDVWESLKLSSRRWAFPAVRTRNNGPSAYARAAFECIHPSVRYSKSRMHQPMGQKSASALRKFRDTSRNELRGEGVKGIPS